MSPRLFSSTYFAEPLLALLDRGQPAQLLEQLVVVARRAVDHVEYISPRYSAWSVTAAQSSGLLIRYFWPLTLTSSPLANR